LVALLGKRRGKKEKRREGEKKKRRRGKLSKI
jgi:hypothetical protein